MGGCSGIAANTWAAESPTTPGIFDAGAIARHVATIRKHCKPGDLECRRRQRQAVLHWAYDSRKIEEGSEMRVFVTGATGFVGRALIPGLQRDGHAAVAWVRSPARARDLLGAEAVALERRTLKRHLVINLRRPLREQSTRKRRSPNHHRYTRARHA